MITTNNLAAELAAKYGMDPGAARAAVETYAGQINDDDTLYDCDTDELTDEGADLVRDQFAVSVEGSGAPKHNDDDPVTLAYSSSSNISFHGKGIDTGYTWGEWRDMTREEQDAAITDIVFELVDVSVEDNEDDN